MQPVKIDIEDVLDLHTFKPEDVPDLLEDYIFECIEAGILSMRIIHGKGKGIQKKRVQKLLKNNPKVESFQDAPPEAGGWGATLVELKKDVTVHGTLKLEIGN
jgi:dsDNA-specific endonuclease/ATPase MutS2